MNFFESVYELVARIPRGRVATYGQLAALISTPRAARAVGWALRALPPDTKLPWQRVVNGKGVLTISSNPLFLQTDQAERLKADGVEVSKEGDTYHLDIKKYLVEL